MRQEMYAWKEQSLEEIALNDQENSAKEFHAVQSWLRVSESDQLTIFESVADQSNKYPGTCSWVLQSPKIKSWLQRTSQTSMLWLSGSAGTGKSVISTQLINHMRDMSRVTVLYHFCTSVSLISCEYEQVVKSLLEQLLRQDADFTTHVYHDYVLKKHPAKVSVLERLLQSLLMSLYEDPNHTRYIWIVLDGIDGLRDHSPNSQARLLSFMKQLVKKTSSSGSAACKVLLSSRSSTTMFQVLRKKSTLSLTDEKASLNEAIRKYSSQRLGNLHIRLHELGLDAKEIDDIVIRISDKADGESIPLLIEI